MLKICFVGAGSSVFAKNLLMDILQNPELHDIELALFDIDADRLAVSQRMSENLVAQMKAPSRVVSYTDRKQALKSANYVITMMQVGGYKPCTVTDFEIPKKYGLRQTIADTLGIGGIMRGLRTIPVILDLAQDMEELCPDAHLLNYVNPMAMLQMALHRKFPGLKTLGLCHSVRYTIQELAADLKMRPADIDFQCAGINHVAFYLQLTDKSSGESLYPRLHKILEEGAYPNTNRVRYEMLRRLGYFVTESSEHFSEYVPWFIKGNCKTLIKDFNIPLDEYIRRCEAQLQDWGKMKQELQDPKHKFELTTSVEYAENIISALEFDSEVEINPNVSNEEGWIENLPRDCCVEVPCKIDRKGVQPVKVGALPVHLAALMQSNINVQQLTVAAALENKREHIYHAAMMDPHTGAELGLKDIWNMVDDLLEAHKDWLPTYS